MEGKTGFDVAQYLREVGHTPFVFLSAFSDEETVAKVKAMGALAYLVKPLEVGQIVPTIDAAFSRAQQIRTAEQLQSPLATEQPLDDKAVASALVPLAVGVLMHRFSLTRPEALARLRRLAAAEKRAVTAQAERLVLAVEELSATREPTA
jgi:response regulator NasT